jgi:5-methylcytosine-specific restriction endonuclease McrA
MMDSIDCMKALEGILAEAGTSKFWRCVDSLRRRRLEVKDRPARKHYPWGEYRRLYEQQGGLCPLCQEVMPLIRGKVEMDHVNCNATGEEFNARSNRQVVCKACNREKSAKTMYEMSKLSGKTMAEMRGAE